MRFRTLCVLAVAVACMATVASVQADYVSTVLADNPFLYFRLNETAVENGNAAVNAGSTGVGGTYVVNANGDFGDPSSVVDASSTDLSPGKQFNHYVAATDGGTIAVPSQGLAYEELTSFTFEMLLNPANYNAGEKAVFYSNYFASHAVQLEMSGGGIGSYAFPQAAAPKVDISAAAPIGEWSHVAVTETLSDITGAEMKVYVNGVLIGTGTSGIAGGLGTLRANFNSSMQMGNYFQTWGRLFDGGLDEFAIYGTALSGATIAAHADAAGLLVPEPGAITLLACGLISLLAYAWRKRK